MSGGVPEKSSGGGAMTPCATALVTNANELSAAQPHPTIVGSFRDIFYQIVERNAES
jgi:hypothetical protein